MSVATEFHASNAKKLTKSLTQVRDTILAYLGYPQQCVGEISEADVEMFILDALNLVSKYRPKQLEKTVPITTGTRDGIIAATGIFYPSTWSAGDAEPLPAPRQDVQCYLRISPTQSVHGGVMYNGMVTDEFGFASAGLGIRAESMGGQSSLSQFHGSFDNFLDFQMVYQNLQAGMSLRKDIKFSWEQDQNRDYVAYYSNLAVRVNALTITLALDHSLGNKFYLPSTDVTVGTKVVEYDETITGFPLYYTQNIALAYAKRKVGEVRSKFQGGMGQFQLNGDTLIQEADVLEEKMIEELKSQGDHYGYFNDSY
jgi:hypothetical protein